MANASIQIDLPELPDALRDRIVPYHSDFDIAGSLRALEHHRPGLFKTMERMIGVLEAYPGIMETSIDYDEEDTYRPVTIWARSTFPLDERESQLRRIFDISQEELGYFRDLVLVGVM
jgi:hypothetical protein